MTTLLKNIDQVIHSNNSAYDSTIR